MTHPNLIEIDSFLKQAADNRLSADYLQEMRLLAQINCPIVLYGETGVGKTYMAKTIHCQSQRCNQPFIDANAATIPEALFESVFFGHHEGAFTDARTSHRGFLQQADGGTLFIDEVAELSDSIQAKFLKILDGQPVWPLGASAPVKVDVRFIFATNANLAERVRAGKFREDLYYRIAAAPVCIPSLRKRREEIMPLFLEMLKTFAQEYGKTVTHMTKGAWETIQNHDWPGNIRQLKFCAQRAAIMLKNQTLLQSDIVIHGDHLKPDRARLSLSDIELLPLPDALQQLERHIISERLRQCKTISKTARECQISRQTLRSKCKEYDLLSQ